MPIDVPAVMLHRASPSRATPRAHAGDQGESKTPVIGPCARASAAHGLLAISLHESNLNLGLKAAAPFVPDAIRHSDWLYCRTQLSCARPSLFASPGVPYLPRVPVHTAAAQTTVHNRQMDGCLLFCPSTHPACKPPKVDFACHRYCFSRWGDAYCRTALLPACSTRFGCFRGVQRAYRQLVTSPRDASIRPGKPFCLAYEGGHR